MKNIVIIILIIMSTSSAGIVDFAGDHGMSSIDGSAEINSLSHVDHGQQTQGAECCHKICMCCAGQSILLTPDSASDPVNESVYSRVSTFNPRNPHLNELKRPPRIA